MLHSDSHGKLLNVTIFPTEPQVCTMHEGKCISNHYSVTMKLISAQEFMQCDITIPVFGLLLYNDNCHDSLCVNRMWNRDYVEGISAMFAHSTSLVWKISLRQFSYLPQMQCSNQDLFEIQFQLLEFS